MRFLVLGLLGLLATPVGLAMQQQVDRPTLCSMAKAVVIAEPTSVETQWAAGDRGGIERRTWLSVLTSLRGPTPDSLEVILPGGSINGISQWVEDVPTLTLDQPYLLFLGEHNGRLHIIGGDQGAVQIRSTDNEPGESLRSAIASIGDCRAQN